MTAWYNEIDPYAANWLRRHIEAGRIPRGEVDERDIRDVGAEDLHGFTQVHLFAGIGGWPYAARIAGWRDDWPLWTGSCPCQPFSAAGRRKGTDDPRHLWPEMRRLIAECNPPIIFGEQVASPLGREWLAGVRADLEALGYAVGAADLCAAGVGAPHIRQRLWWGAVRLDNSMSGRHQQSQEEIRTRRQCAQLPSKPGRLGDTDYTRSQGRVQCGDSTRERPVGSAGLADFWSDFDIVECADGKARRIEPGTFPLAHGVPDRVGRLRAYGNAIVPQVAEKILTGMLHYMIFDT